MDTILFKDIDTLLIDGDRSENYPSEQDFFNNEYCLFLDASNITSNGFDFSNTHFITKEKDLKLKKGKLELNDIVLMTRGSVGNVALYDETIPYKNVRINSGMIIIRCQNDFESKEMFYLLQSNYIKNQIEHLMSGSVQKQLPASIVKEIKLLHLNNKSVSIMRNIDNQIKRNNEMVQKLPLLEKGYSTTISCFSWKGEMRYAC